MATQYINRAHLTLTPFTVTYWTTAGAADPTMADASAPASSTYDYVTLVYDDGVAAGGNPMGDLSTYRTNGDADAGGF